MTRLSLSCVLVLLAACGDSVDSVTMDSVDAGLGMADARPSSTDSAADARTADARTPDAAVADARGADAGTCTGPVDWSCPILDSSLKGQLPIYNAIAQTAVQSVGTCTNACGAPGKSAAYALFVVENSGLPFQPVKVSTGVYEAVASFSQRAPSVKDTELLAGSSGIPGSMMGQVELEVVQPLALVMPSGDFAGLKIEVELPPFGKGKIRFEGSQATVGEVVTQLVYKKESIALDLSDGVYRYTYYLELSPTPKVHGILAH